MSKRWTWPWRRVMLTALALMAALAAATTADARVDHARSVTHKAVPAQAKTVTIGSKNFPEQYILGELYKQALEAKGYKVTYKKGVGSTELIHTALEGGEIDFYPEYTGTALAVVFGVANPPKTASAVYNALKTREADKGLTLFRQTPFYDSDAIAVLKSTAQQYKLKSIGDLKKLGSKLTLGAFPEFRTRPQGIPGLKKNYGLTKVKFKPYPKIPVYQGLDSKKILAADVFTTDPQLATGKYVVLQDPKRQFGFQNVAPIVSQDKASELGASFRRTVDAVSAKLTLPAVRAMLKANYENRTDPKVIANAFLKANKLK